MKWFFLAFLMLFAFVGNAIFIDQWSKLKVIGGIAFNLCNLVVRRLVVGIFSSRHCESQGAGDRSRSHDAWYGHRYGNLGRRYRDNQ